MVRDQKGKDLRRRWRGCWGGGGLDRHKQWSELWGTSRLYECISEMKKGSQSGVHAVVERDQADVTDRVAAQNGVAVKSECVLALHLAFHARALSEGDVAGREDFSHPQLARQNFSHHTIGRTGHPGIGFGDEQNVARLQVWVRAEGIELRLELRPALDVPRENAIARPRRRFPIAKIGDVRRGQRSGDQRGDGPVLRVDLQFGCRTALRQGFETGQDLARDGGIDPVLGWVVYLHSNGWARLRSYQTLTRSFHRLSAAGPRG